MAEDRNKIDFIFIPIPLWVTYSGLPEKIGFGPWNVFRRLLELRQRFNSSTFFYPQDSLRVTCGFKSIRGLHNMLSTLVEANLIIWTPGRGRGNATEFTIIEPLQTPLSEEEVYQKHPRLRPKGYVEPYSEIKERKMHSMHLLDEEKMHDVHLLPERKMHSMHLLNEEKVDAMHLLVGQKVHTMHPNKKDCKKDNNKSDLYPENEENNHVVVLLDRLKKYRLSRKLIEKYLEEHLPAYLEEKIEIIEFMRNQKKKLKNPGGMLRRAIEEDWQPPEGFTTEAERQAQVNEKRGRILAAAAQEREKERQSAEQERIEKAVERWRAGAPKDLLEEIKARAVSELEQELPNLDRKLARIPIKLRMNEIIAREYLDQDDIKENAKEEENGRTS